MQINAIFITPLVKRSLIYELISCITGLLDTVDGVLNHALSLIFYEIVICELDVEYWSFISSRRRSADISCNCGLLHAVRNLRPKTCIGVRTGGGGARTSHSLKFNVENYGLVKYVIRLGTVG